MYQINNEKFGQFISELRKEKKLTQKELAEKLYVSDKTVSKWERGASIPNVVLLIPIAELFDVTVTELLTGERIQQNQSIEKKEIEDLAVESLDLSIKDMIQRRKKYWSYLYFTGLGIFIIESLFIINSNISFSLLKDSYMISIMMLILATWLCFFSKELPQYYDDNKINVVSQGIFRIHMVGLSFNNSNWIYILNILKVFSLLIMILSPIFSFSCIQIAGLILYESIKMYVAWGILILMVGFIYYVGKKYE